MMSEVTRRSSGPGTMPDSEPTAKERMLEIIREQPDDSSYDEILRELAFTRMVERGLADSDRGDTIDGEEMEKRISSWGS